MGKQLATNRRNFLRASGLGICAACLAAAGRGGCASRPKLPPEQAYLEKNRKKMLDDFDAVFNPVRKLIVELAGEKDAAAIINESRKAYEGLLPQVPYIGGDDNSLSETLYMSAAALGFYQAMLAHGQPLEQTGRIMYRAMEAMFTFKDPLAMAQSRDPNGKAAQDEFLRLESWLMKSPYPGDWRMTFVKGDGKNFDFGVDYTECGIVKFYQAQQAEELAPYMCLGDFPLSKALNSGLARTTTLALGGKKCDFRWKAGRKVQMEWTPEFLKEE